jgi:predicted signal transduction protein with EAL and GGDEF domain
MEPLAHNGGRCAISFIRQTSHGLLKRADITMYEAKKAERNRVVSADDIGIADYSDKTTIVRSPKSTW